MLRAMLLSRPKPPQAGTEGQPLQGHSSQRQLFTKVSGPPLAAASTPGRRANRPPRRAKFTHSKFERHIFRRSALRSSAYPTTYLGNRVRSLDGWIGDRVEVRACRIYRHEHSAK